MLDNAGLEYVQIAASNQLDEYVIKSILDQKAPIDVFGVGTKLVTAYDEPALDGVYKLSSINGNPTLKISENVEKITLPDIKELTRFVNKDGSFNCDGISLDQEKTPETIFHPFITHKSTNVSQLQPEQIAHKVVENGKVIAPSTSIKESAEYAKQRLSKLNDEHKRFDNPHVYKVGVSEGLRKLKDQLVQNN
jgi:nicotinate phosphoribosyltransferase